jgi:pyruvate/2-oxoglutarate/acetoin dehydrogenase E1 component
MAKLTYREAVKEALREAMSKDDRVFLMGEDVGHYGGCYAVSKGLIDEFGDQRILDTPLSESGFVGAGIGAAMGGLRPIVEVMTVNFSLLALDQILNNAATLRHMSGGQLGVPIVIRMATGSGKQLAAQHSHSLENWYAHIPGLKVYAPATVTDARYMLAEALKDPDPVLIFEHVMLYNREEELMERPDIYNPEKAEVVKEGRDVTLVTYGGSLYKAIEASQRCLDAGIDAEVIDLRCLRPLDMATILNSVAKTHRLVIVDEAWKTGSLASEISAYVAEYELWSLDAPVMRVCSQEVPIPYPAHLEKAATPQVEDIVSVMKLVMGRKEGRAA